MSSTPPKLVRRWKRADTCIIPNHKKFCLRNQKSHPVASTLQEPMVGYPRVPTNKGQAITPLESQTVAAIPEGSSINLLERISSSIGIG
jgi:hypothetical protein